MKIRIIICLFFNDVAQPASLEGGTEAIFADDLNVFQLFDRHATCDAVKDKLNKTREHVHRWGHRNRVIFDASKEHLIIIHPDHGEGSTFKLLGCMIDTSLLMHEAVDAIIAKMRPKIKAILRLRAHYSLADMLMQYKTHIWGYTEY